MSEPLANLYARHAQTAQEKAVANEKKTGKSE